MIQSKQNKRIPVADKPLRLGGQITLLSHDEFERQFGCQYMEKVDYIVDANLLEVPENIRGYLTSVQLKTQLRHLLENPRDDLVICKINESVGCGVFARDDIPKDTVLCFYSGTLMSGQKTKYGDYGLAFYGMNAQVSTQSHRGISSFFEHLPSALKMPDIKRLQFILKMIGQQVSEHDLKLHDELYSIQFDNERIKASLATENLRQEFINYNGLPVILLVTNNAIQAGEQLGFNYGSSYFRSRGLVPELFNKTGELIPGNVYKRTFWQLTLDEVSYIGELQPLIDQLRQGKTQVDFVDDEGFPRRIDSQIVADELLRIHAIANDEHQRCCNQSNDNLSSNLFFSHPDLTRLIKKYKLADSSQVSLEKGLRNAATNNLPDDIRTFLNYVQNVNAADTNPTSLKTALHWAASKSHHECCDILLAAGADPSLADATGNTPQKYMDGFLAPKP